MSKHSYGTIYTGYALRLMSYACLIKEGEEEEGEDELSTIAIPIY